MIAAELIVRARSALAENRARRGKPPVRYPDKKRQDRLPASSAAHPEEAPDVLDCSTFVRWAARIRLPDRTPDGAELWWDTTQIVRDALGPKDFFERLGDARPGCLIVYPDYRAVPEVSYTARSMLTGEMGDAASNEHDGHVGIVTETFEKDGRAEARKVIHCSQLIQIARLTLLPGMPEDSVIESDPLWFPSNNPIYARIKAIDW